MGLPDLLAIVRTSWKLLILAMVLCLAAAVYVTARAVPQYSSTARLYVSAQVGESNLGEAYTGGLLSQQRIASYTSIVASDAVVAKVLQKDGSGRSLESVESRITVSSPLNTVLLDIGFTDASPVVAQRTATAVATEFAAFVSVLEMSNGANSSPVRVTLVEPAKLPRHQVSPNPVRNIAFGLLAGLAIGLGGLTLRRSLDRSVRTVADLQQLGLTLLGTVPEDKSAGRQPVLLPQATHTARAEAFRQIRTNVLFLNVDDSVRSMVITSAVGQEGKSSTTANLGIAFAQTGLSVVVVEGDLRRPRLAGYLGLEGSEGLTDVLLGTADLDDVLQPWGGDLLHVIASGPLPSNPSELLSSQRAADLIGELERRFDIVLIDSPPLLQVTDAAVLAASATCALLVVRRGGSTHDEVRAAVSALGNVNAKLGGVVLNGVTGGDSGSYVEQDAASTGSRGTGGQPNPQQRDGSDQPVTSTR